MTDKKDIVMEMKQMIAIALTITIAIALFIAQKEEYQAVFSEDMVEGVLTLLLIGVTFWWLIRWFFFGRNELNLLADYLILDTNYFNRSRTSQYIFPLLLAIGFGLLIGFGFNLSIFIICVVFVQLTAFIGDNITIRVLAQDLLGDHSPINIKDYKNDKYNDLINTIYKIRKEIVKYYFEGLYFLRVPFSLLLLFFAWLLLHDQISISGTVDLYLTYLLVILSIFINEFHLIIIRNKRNKSIDILETEYRDKYKNDPSVDELKRYNNNDD